ncbi:MAG: gamma-glutamyl-gamma-aminobutyrate hydrolase family protein, partial [Chloroflexota bacterium]
MAPLIGITTYGLDERDLSSPYYSDYYALPALYVDSVRRAGGVPLLIPPGETGWQAIIAKLDGLIVSGGSDIDPERYDGNPHHPSLTPIDKVRDQSEFELIHELVSMDKEAPPTLCICRGMQVLNVALGGSLTEHVADILDEDMHRGPDGIWALHDVSIKAGSKLALMMGSSNVNTLSGHHQAIKAVGKGLKVVATSADGVIEGLEHPGFDLLVGVQWHPEKTAAEDPTQQSMFDKLIEY